MKTIAIIGAGKGLGMSIAKRFGREGFQVALVARKEEKLKQMVDELTAENITAAYFIGDVKKQDEMNLAAQKIIAHFGSLDIVKFNANPAKEPPTYVFDVTEANMRDAFEGYTLGGMHVVNAFLPIFRVQKRGAFLFTVGLSSVYPLPKYANVGPAMSALRNYVADVRTALKDEDDNEIRVLFRAFGVVLRPGSGKANDPDIAADMWYQVYSSNKNDDDVYPDGVTDKTIVR